MVQRFFVFWDDCGLIWLGIINKRVQTTIYNPPVIPFRYFEQYNNNNIKQYVVAKGRFFINLSFMIFTFFYDH